MTASRAPLNQVCPGSAGSAGSAGRIEKWVVGMRAAGIVVGIAIILTAIGAFLSGEPATRTSSGMASIVFGVFLGLYLIFSSAGKSTKKETTAVAQPTSAGAIPPAPPSLGKCPRCGKGVSAEYVACPYCSLTLKPMCPSCGKELKPEFIVCPFCGKSPRPVDASP